MSPSSSVRPSRLTVPETGYVLGPASPQPWEAKPAQVTSPHKTRQDWFRCPLIGASAPLFRILIIAHDFAAGPTAQGQVRLWVNGVGDKPDRSEEHTSELQSQFHLVCRLLLEKKKKKKKRKKYKKK